MNAISANLKSNNGIAPALACPWQIILLFLIFFGTWDWFISLAEADAAASLGHKITIQHLHLRLDRNIRIAAIGIAAENPSCFPADAPQLASIGRLLVDVDLQAYLEHQEQELAERVAMLIEGTSRHTAIFN